MFSMSGLFTFVIILIFIDLLKIIFLRDSFKCADSLTVHRRRLHLLPLLDKIDDEDDKQDATNSNDKQDVTTFFFEVSKFEYLFSHNVNTLVIYVNDVFD
jgi:hypothetical protein